MQVGFNDTAVLLFVIFISRAAMSSRPPMSGVGNQHKQADPALSTSLRSAAALLLGLNSGGEGQQHSVAGGAPRTSSAPTRPATAGNARSRPNQAASNINNSGLGVGVGAVSSRPSTAYSRPSSSSRQTFPWTATVNSGAFNGIMTHEEVQRRLEREASNAVAAFDFALANRLYSQLFASSSSSSGQQRLLPLRLAASAINFSVTLAICGLLEAALSRTEEIIESLRSSSPDMAGDTIEISPALLLQAAQHNRLVFSRLEQQLRDATSFHAVKSSQDIFRSCFTFVPEQEQVAVAGTASSRPVGVAEAAETMLRDIPAATSSEGQHSHPTISLCESTLHFFLQMMSLSSGSGELMRFDAGKSEEHHHHAFPRYLKQGRASCTVADASMLLINVMHLGRLLIEQHIVVVKNRNEPMVDSATDADRRSAELLARAILEQTIVTMLPAQGTKTHGRVLQLSLRGASSPFSTSVIGFSILAGKLCHLVASTRYPDKSNHRSCSRRRVFEAMSNQWVSQLAHSDNSISVGMELEHDRLAVLLMKTPAVVLESTSSLQHGGGENNRHKLEGPPPKSLLHQSECSRTWHNALRMVRMLFRFAKERYMTHSGLGKLRLLVSRQHALKELGYYYSTAISTSEVLPSVAAADLLLRPRELAVQAEPAFDGGPFGGVTSDVVGDALRAGARELMRSQPLVSYAESAWIAFGGLLASTLVEGRSYNLGIPAALWFCMVHPRSDIFCSCPHLLPRQLLWEAAEVIDPTLAQQYRQQLSASQSQGHMSISDLCSHLSRSSVKRAQESALAAILRFNVNKSAPPPALSIIETSDAFRDLIVLELLCELVVKRRRKMMTAVKQYLDLFTQVIDDKKAHSIIFGHFYKEHEMDDDDDDDDIFSTESMNRWYAFPLDDGDVVAINIMEALQGPYGTRMELPAEDIVSILDFRDWSGQGPTPQYLCQWVHGATAMQRRAFLRLCCGMDAVPYFTRVEGQQQAEERSDTTTTSRTGGGARHQPQAQRDQTARIVVQFRPQEAPQTGGGDAPSTATNSTGCGFRSSANAVFAQTCFFTLFLPKYPSFAALQEAMDVAVLVVAQDPSMAESGQ